jgi:amidase
MLTPRDVVAGLLMASATGAAAVTPDPQLTGRWEVTTTYPGGTYVAGLELSADGQNYVGRSGHLVHDGPFPYKYSGTLQQDGLHLQIRGPGENKPFGALLLKENNGTLSGSGQLYDLPISVSARRPRQPPDAPRVIIYEPKVFYGSYSGANPPALHIFPGDTVRTKTRVYWVWMPCVVAC